MRSLRSPQSRSRSPRAPSLHRPRNCDVLSHGGWVSRCSGIRDIDDGEIVASGLLVERKRRSSRRCKLGARAGWGRLRGGIGERRERPRSRASEPGQGPWRPVFRSPRDPDPEGAMDARSAAVGARPPRGRPQPARRSRAPLSRMPPAYWEQPLSAAIPAGCATCWSTTTWRRSVARDSASSRRTGHALHSRHSRFPP